MAFAYKFDVLAALKEEGYSSYRLRSEKLLSNSAIQKLRLGKMVTISNLETICTLLHLQPGSVVGMLWSEEDDSMCTSLTTINIPQGVTSIGCRAFEDFSLLTSISIPCSVTSIGDYAFNDCTSLTTITIPDTVTSIGYKAFNNCTNLTTIYVKKNSFSHQWCLNHGFDEKILFY